jgi:hypothetical protein
MKLLSWQRVVAFSLLVLIEAIAMPARAQLVIPPGGTLPVPSTISPNPSGVNVRHQGPTTVFLTFRGLRPDQRAAEGIWCGEIDPVLQTCLAGTVFGRLPDRFDLGRDSQSGASNNFTDVMNIPHSVARRAYQAARRGDDSRFFYVRRFRSTSGAPDMNAAVTCRMAGGGARSPLAIVDVRIRFDVDRPVLFTPRGVAPPPLGAEIVYNGGGRLKGRWEVVSPGDPLPSELDLLPEAALPVELRGNQRRYPTVGRFDLFLPPTGRATIPGPDPRRLPHAADGLHHIILRIEASEGADSRSSTDPGNPLAITVAGGVAGFAMPPLRYYVGTGERGRELAILAARESLVPIAPNGAARLATGDPLNFAWTGHPEAAGFELQVEDAEGKPVLRALVTGQVLGYTAPPWVRSRSDGNLRWRIVALDLRDRPLGRSAWREFRIELLD